MTTTREEYKSRRWSTAARMFRDSDRFDIADFRSSNECGTTYCVAGWALVDKFGEEWDYSHMFPGLLQTNLTKQAADYLGIPMAEADYLFFDFDLDTVEKAVEKMMSMEYVV